MGVIKCRGLVLNEQPAGEADKILTLFTKEYGKLRVSAKGARKLKSRYFSGSCQFCYCDFVLYSSRDFYSVTQIDLIEGFKAIPTDFDRVCYGNYFLEIVDKSAYEHAPNDRVLYLLLSALMKLNRGKTPNTIIARGFEFKFMQLSGYIPVLGECSMCAEPVEAELPLFFGHEGLICADCASREPVKTKIHISTVQAIDYIINADIKNVFSFAVNDKTAGELQRCAEIFFFNLDIGLNSKRLIDNIESRIL